MTQHAPRVSIRRHAADGYRALLALETSLAAGPVPKSTLELIRLRVSQINGCGFCVDMHARDARRDGETDERLATVAAWRETPYFTDAERAALALAEAATRIADRAEGVPQDVWDEAARHYDEPALATLVMAIAAINAWNRINVTVRNLAGS
ncbi:carboxymuconolactone decarboxylase family protein [Streptomyces litchfieldiae]|uniref:Carboxymuconolactone decarboxylase family protein n=1 Tax=Streptomyces litchfieldiae TaxID=3075543 RepID=A0ABU2MJP0_9ACTN|nr:carboxymuconolactone decarboxylase family protein [Streptomyces sp. DSM 44938]MDT0341823.1 carboxymuconolactone decarboxylase family protein [Streptomyces sp. DSM 44938]